MSLPHFINTVLIYFSLQHGPFFALQITKPTSAVFTFCLVEKMSVERSPAAVRRILRPAAPRSGLPPSTMPWAGLCRPLLPMAHGDPVVTMTGSPSPSMSTIIKRGERSQILQCHISSNAFPSIRQFNLSPGFVVEEVQSKLNLLSSGKMVTNHSFITIFSILKLSPTFYPIGYTSVSDWIHVHLLQF